MSNDRERRVRDRAYALWEREGRPSGRHDEHWFRASREIAAETLSDETVTAAAAPNVATNTGVAKSVSSNSAVKPAIPTTEEAWPKDAGSDDMETASASPEPAPPRKRAAVRAAPAKVAEAAASAVKKVTGTQRKTTVKPKPAS
ncbi:hypothetical protein FHS96_001689 [Sphingomonas zeicaulis]|uniref:DUF2934 domain-containing protein n=1 Tax=Sphingomonas zeicaulis TaxID=1632740 RepID=UPI003D20306F